MPPRFWSSPYKNAVVTPAKREGWYSELPVAAAVANETSDGIIATGEYWLALGGASGSLVALPYSAAPGKYASRVPTLSTGLRSITSYTTDAFSDLVYVGGEGGIVNVFDLPPSSAFSPDAPSAFSPTPLVSLDAGTGKPIDIVTPHPLASSFALTVSGSTLSVFDVASGKSEAVKGLEMPGLAWSAQWSADGRLITTTGRDGKLRVWDVRQGDGVVAETTAHTGTKPSRHVHLAPTTSSAQQLFSTGFSRTRDRECSLFDLRSLDRAVKTQRLDNNTGVLQPLLDESRGIVYLAGRGDMTLRWVEVGGPAVFTEGAAPLPAPVLSAALLPPQAQQTHLDLMQAEINRLMVLCPAENAVVPVEVKVPRRQYVDFHMDLYPLVRAGVAALSSSAWLAGTNSEDVTPVEKVQLESGKSWPQKEKPTRTVGGKRSPAQAAAGAEQKEELAPAVPVVSAAAASSQLAAAPASAASPPAVAPSSTPPASIASLPLSEVSLSKEEPPTAALSSLDLDDKQIRPSFCGATKGAAPSTSAPSPVHTAPATSTSPSPTPHSAATRFKAPATALASPKAPSPGEPFNPGWSRKFLTGKTPLKPDYFDIKDLSATTSAEVVLLKATPTYLLYPLSGPGGRLAIHPLSRKGRLPTHPPALQTGATVVDFELDPFGGEKVFVAGDDGNVRVFELPKEVGEGWEEEVNGLNGKVLSDPRMDRINALAHHPASKDVLLSVSDDHGSPAARLWDVARGEVLVQADLPKGGVSSVAWSPDGGLLAVSTKNKQIHILDPRSPSTLFSSPSHDSVRPVRLAWASDSHLISTGFNRTASRELILYKLDHASEALSVSAKQSLDVSPAPLFPYFDLDTRILLLYSRGERSCLAYEVDLEDKGSKTPFAKLPSFDHGTLQSAFAFMPKTRVDVKAVEVIKALRLTPNEVQEVSFTIPRAKAAFFQNDIFVPTRETETPSMTAQDYKEGKDTPLRMVDLRPEGMKLLSDAPVQQKTVSTRSQIKQDGLTDSQREKAYLDNLFQSAKAEGKQSDDSEEDVGRKHQAPKYDSGEDSDW
ncbi:hypothetical protein JCM11641_006621 [Rhodosporidiobolus odoratus]